MGAYEGRGIPPDRSSVVAAWACRGAQRARATFHVVVLLLAASVAIGCDVTRSLTLDYPVGGGGIRHVFTIEPFRPTLHVGGQLLVNVEVSRDDGVQPVVGAIRWWVDEPEVVEVLPATPDRVFLGKPCGDRCALLIGRSEGRTWLYASTILDGRAWTTTGVVTVLP